MTTQAPPPTRHELVSKASAIIMTVDERARASNRKWGHNRLPHLVPLEWLDKFRAQKRKWENACFECSGSPLPEDIETVRKHGEAMLRAFDRLDTIAVEAGADFADPAQWEFELNDGTPCILVRDRSDMGRVNAKGRTVQIWSLEEVADIIAKFPALISVKDAFPGAEVIQMRTSKVVVGALDDSLSDLPF